MHRKQFYFDLPQELIAQYPSRERGKSRLLCLNKATGETSHHQFDELLNYIKPNDRLVFNDTRVIPARMYGRKETGGKVEILVERIVSADSALVHLNASKAPKPGSRLLLENAIAAVVEERVGHLFKLQFQGITTILAMLNQYGHIPLPPYIDRIADTADQERYQTVYAKRQGAVAAPTAGLHFTDDLLQALKAKGVKFSFVTLHVGAGTFLPVRVDDITEHQMHAEYIEVDEATVAEIKETQKQGGRIIAVGTTTVRSLETAGVDGDLKPFRGETDIFIYPGRPFHVIDALVTNFHTPESTLLMLVCAFAGYDQVMQAYHEAVTQKYQFFSYGDAMLFY